MKPDDQSKSSIARRMEDGAGLDVSSLLNNRSPSSTDQPDEIGRDIEPIVSVADTIAKVARQHLNAEIGPDTDIFDAGASSVAIVEIAAILEREHGITLEVDDLFNDPRPRSLAGKWLARTGRSEALPQATTVGPRAIVDELPADALAEIEQIFADISLADRLPLLQAPPATAPKNILLTGATGFLGSHILLDLLRYTDCHIHCLVRSKGGTVLDRLVEALRSFSLPHSSEVLRRVTVISGDLSQPQLGLTDNQWETLAEDIDSIVNVGATVDFLRGYSALRKANVLGPLYLAELAATCRIKPLHHISSIAVFNEVGAPTISEDAPVAHIDRLEAGYDKTKWAAEAALRRARERGMVVTLLRPGGIGGHPETGAHNPHDLSSAMLGALSRFRTTPAFTYVNNAPVDWVSRVATAVIVDPAAWGYNYHLTGVPTTLDDVRRETELAGMNLQILPFDQWRRETAQQIRDTPVPELDFLAWMLESNSASRLAEASLLGPAATSERTDDYVRQTGLPEARRYDMTQQLNTFTQLAMSGIARLPAATDKPYLWFTETMRGTITNNEIDSIKCEMRLTLSIKSMHQLVTVRRIDISGELHCAALDAAPLTVTEGEIIVRPTGEVTGTTETGYPLLRYQLTLRSQSGEVLELIGIKSARARRDIWKQTRTLDVTIRHSDDRPDYVGTLTVPANSYMSEQIDGIRTAPHLSARERRLAKTAWLAWFGSQLGQGFLEPALRATSDLLDSRGLVPRKVRNPLQYKRSRKR